MRPVFWVSLAVVVAASLVAERVAHHAHKYWFTGIPGFFVGFGFVGCVVMIVVAKWYAKHLVQRSEDYYLRHGDVDGHSALTGAESDGAAAEDDEGWR